MAFQTICDACVMGDHSHHRYVVQAVPEGMMGGAVCWCKGECLDGRFAPPPPVSAALPAFDPGITELLDALSDPRPEGESDE